MPRTNTDEVLDAVSTDLDRASVSLWIDVANDYVDDIANSNTTVSSTRLQNIELLLACHFVKIQDPQLEEDSVADSTKVYRGDSGQYFDATTYGQQAQILDPTDTIATASKPQANVHVGDTRNIDRPTRE